MRKITILYIVLITFSCSTTKETSKYNSTGSIHSFEGVDNIIVDTSGMKHIKQTYDKIRIEKYWSPGASGAIFPFFFIGSYKKNVVVNEKGLTFNLVKRRHRFNKRTVFSIVVDSTSTYKTKEGIGIGSSYKDIISVYGKKKLASGSTLRGNVTHIYYRDSNKKASILFNHFGHVDTNNFIVQEIVIM